MWKADQSYYHDSNRQRVCVESDPAAHFLIICKSGEMNDHEAEKLGLIDAQSKAKVTHVEAKAQTSPPENKAQLRPSEIKADSSKAKR